ncbi:exodeoxyribonuclease V subunit alpha [Pseudonocardia sp. KRD-184]|uniref:RecBCD enzyme subunit RecD n=1 Tax=Pseudonocardia oceani TaxID=2792013 RepID=A0ABS6UEQ6_9PSEU|nr:exodeoxyribonuclease V subunit alpha [Pseudonocardia oceani]MBW0096556.1 exodeoxyribonuclease V subunit alpha [Pseudonocardia oceani]MBW0109170.1 exodeoxyribonuclease V subunit alpha [Pseudonocardia oceani]MBW0123229.1 exodeoxyribonuclease V subunit alpha [Pseudonocardia oceani]MBW0130732.1 exodeoxyribonuclease V subunit alpha [Pseudonocardia oceani]
MPAEADPHDARLVLGASGLLAQFNAAGVLDAADVHTAERVGRLGGECDESVLLAVALAVRAVRLGSVCVDLAAADRTVLGEGDELLDVSALPWPEPGAWHAACLAGPLVADGAGAPPGRPLRMVAGQLYLERYWREEELVRLSLRERAAAAPPAHDLAALRAGLDVLFPDPLALRQRQAAAVASLRRVTVLAGGPGTGKTTTVAALLTLLLDQPGPSPRIALAAPTGKAAARLQEAVAERLSPAHRERVAEASTLHRLLGWRPGGGSGVFRHDRTHRLPYDVIVVDETSMVSLTMMARLLDAVRPDARLVLVGDPDQLASVEAGAVLGDLARAAGRPEPALDSALAALAVPTGVVHGVVTLDHVWRFDGAIAELARAVQAGDAERALAVLRRGDPALAFTDDDGPAAAEGARADVVAAGRALADAARAGDVDAAVAGLDTHRVLCAHRRGPYGVARWTLDVDRWLAHGGSAREPWWPGRAVLVTTNDYDAGLFNGDTGVAVDTPDGLRVAFARGGPPTLFAPSRLSEVTGVHAMTVHRGQGSQFTRVTVVLPPAESPLLTRELLYTAVTRAKEFVRVVGTADAVRAAVERPVARASGLRHRLDS